MEKVKINIVPKGLKPACYVSQNDNGRVVRFELFDELTPYTLDGSETITITVVRPDGVELVSSVVNTEDSYIDVVFSDDMTAIAGIADCELTITDGETVIGSRNFDMNIEIDAYNGKDVVIETATGVIASFNTEVEDNALEYESEIPYNAEGYTGLEIINSRTAPAYDKTPYLFRKTPDNFGNSCKEKIIGASVAFNQLVQNGNFESTTGWGTSNASFSVSDNTGYILATAQNGRIQYVYTAIANHVYICSIFAKITSGSCRLDFYAKTKTSTKTNEFEQLSIIDKISTSGNIYYPRVVDLRSENWDNIEVQKCNIIDLTAMFGSTIADYIYSLETAQSGAGVAYFKALFGADYYAYNTGELMSVKTSGRKTIGFNQWNEITEIGTIDTTTGQNQVYNNELRSKDYIPCLPDTTYYNYKNSGSAGYIYYYDANKNYIQPVYMPQNATFKTPKNAHFFRFRLGDAYGTTYKNDVCINISDPSRNGQYEPYNAVTYPLDPDIELRGIPKLDENNNLYYDGDTYESTSKVNRRYGVVDLGSLEWNYEPDYNRHGALFSQFVNAPKIPTSSQVPNAISTYQILSSNDGWAYRNTVTAIAFDNTYLHVYNDGTASGSDYKTAMSGVYLVYELETPTTESADPYTDPQEARITEEFIDNRAIPIPVGQDSIYGTDIEYQDIDFDTTIFGGDINAIDGVLTSRYNSDGSVKTTPEIIDITPTPIPVKAGDNKIFNSADGDQTIRYYNQVE